MRARGARLARALVAAAAVLAACEPYVQGNGTFVEEHRDLAPFLGVHVEDGIRAIVSAGAAARSVAVSGDANLVQWVRTEVRDEDVRGESVRVLRVWIDLEDFDVAIPVQAVVRTGGLRYALAAEDAEVDLGAVAAGEMVVVAHGHGVVRLGGPGGAALHATLDDASLDAHTYPVASAEVSLSNGSRVELNASAAVTGTVDASSSLDNLSGAGECLVSGGGLVCCRPALTCPP